MSVEDRVADHYTTGSLIGRIKSAMREMGADMTAPTHEDLKLVDEFHTGGLEATEALLKQIDLSPDASVLDIGSGIGGTARFVTTRYGCQVHGIDLTQEFVDTARELSNLVGLSGPLEFAQGSALAIPHHDNNFDLALLLHVGMNIEDKQRLMAEAARVLKPGGQFAVFDVMQGTGESPLVFPLPWSSVPETSFVHSPQVYQSAAEAAGLNLISSRDRTEFANTFFEKVFARIADQGAPPLGIHLLMGDTAKQKIANYVENLHADRIAPTEMIFRKPA